jgi:hypothetical protein
VFLNPRQTTCTGTWLCKYGSRLALRPAEHYPKFSDSNLFGWHINLYVIQPPLKISYKFSGEGVRCKFGVVPAAILKSVHCYLKTFGEKLLWLVKNVARKKSAANHVGGFFFFNFLVR